MLNILIIFTTFFAEMFISYSFFSQLGDKKYSNFKSMIIGLILFESGTLVYFLFSNDIINGIYFAIINTIFATICFNLELRTSILYSILLDFFSTTLEIVSLTLVSRIINTPASKYLEQSTFLVLSITISKTLYALTCQLFAKFISNKNFKLKFPISLYFYPIIVVATLLIFWDICSTSNITKKQQLLISIISFVLFFSIIYIFIAYQHNIEKENKLFELESELNKIQIDKNYYEILEKQNEDLMIYAHDTKKHLSAISEINNNFEVTKYLTEMTNDLKKYSNTCNSGNHMLDIIINKYSKQSEMNNIEFDFDVHLANFNYIENYDLVTIFGNILDNAIESALKSNKRSIELYTNHINTYDTIVVSNSCDTVPILKQNKLVSSKENKKIHGLGIKSVSKTLKKYNGDFSWNYDEQNNIFTLTIMILNECKN